MSTASEPVGTLDVALAHTARLLQTQPLLAAEQAREILKALPGHPHARLLLATALRLNGDARVGRYRVDVENFESIHNHSAYARIERA